MIGTHAGCRHRRQHRPARGFAQFRFRRPAVRASTLEACARRRQLRFPRRLFRMGLYEHSFLQHRAGRVGALVEMAVRKGHETRPGLETGVCGEHGGDPASVSSSTAPASTTSAVRRFACRSRAWRQPTAIRTSSPPETTRLPLPFMRAVHASRRLHRRLRNPDPGFTGHPLRPCGPTRFDQPAAPPPGVSYRHDVRPLLGAGDHQRTTALASSARCRRKGGRGR